jgi:hypothetical protein
MAEGAQGAEIYTCLFSVWGQCSFSRKCIRIDKNVKKIAGHLWLVMNTRDAHDKMEEASDMDLEDRI